MRQQRGFTLLELLVAMVIFSMLAVAGWQVFDGVSKARERAQVQADILAAVQYSHLQMQQDMAQLVPYPALTAEDTLTSSTPDPAKQIAPMPFLTLNTTRVEFIRFADPDPRYRSSPTLQRVAYAFEDNRLVRHQYVSLDTNNNVSIDSVLLSAVSEGRWQAYVPEASERFPDESTANTAQDDNNNERILLPQGIGVSFTYQNLPLTWRWALAPQPVQVPKIVSNTPNANGSNGNSGNGKNNAGNNNPSGAPNSGTNGTSGTNPAPPATNSTDNTGGIVREQNAQGAGL
ncbi:type II secretion system minor pseudopilin GspJ [Psychrobacter aestuarii]|uniref:Type II secretion system protein J n=1 Tax=Psychrobacter aestuarii TaxID=556327 RepID=A0ABN0VN22_9GAMM|nr:type II secretion system minor pseudopilin GspJ [Psychrobacter aestuarii]